jgi:hypothetical protein
MNVAIENNQGPICAANLPEDAPLFQIENQDGMDFIFHFYLWIILR